MSTEHMDTNINAGEAGAGQQASQSPAPKRGTWSPEEDRRLLHLVDQSKVIKWVEIAEHLGTRTSKQCRERYHQKLKPSLSHEPISADESEQIERLVALYGKRWALIARHLKGRSDNVIKNWWNASLNRRRLTSVHLSPAPAHGVQQDEGSYPDLSPSSSYFSHSLGAGSADNNGYQESAFAANILNSRFGTSAGSITNKSANDSMPSPRSQSSYETTDRAHLFAPPTIGVEFNPRYADKSINKGAGTSFGNTNTADQAPRAYSTSGLEAGGSFNPFPDSELKRSRVWSEFGLYSDELARTTPSSVEALSLNRYSLEDPNFGVSFERRRTVCPSQLPSLFSSVSSSEPSGGESRSVSDVSSTAATDYYSNELSAGARSDRGYRSSGDSASPSRFSSLQRDSKLSQFSEFPGKFGHPESGQHSIECTSGSLGGPPGGLPAVNDYGAKRPDHHHNKSQHRSHSHLHQSPSNENTMEMES